MFWHHSHLSSVRKKNWSFFTRKRCLGCGSHHFHCTLPQQNALETWIKESFIISYRLRFEWKISFCFAELYCADDRWWRLSFSCLISSSPISIRKKNLKTSKVLKVQSTSKLHFMKWFWLFYSPTCTWHTVEKAQFFSDWNPIKCVKSIKFKNL